MEENEVVEEVIEEAVEPEEVIEETVEETVEETEPTEDIAVVNDEEAIEEIATED